MDLIRQRHAEEAVEAARVEAARIERERAEVEFQQRWRLRQEQDEAVRVRWVNEVQDN